MFSKKEEIKRERERKKLEKDGDRSQEKRKEM